jgi:hypothetical protein
MGGAIEIGDHKSDVAEEPVSADQNHSNRRDESYLSEVRVGAYS